MLSLYPSAGEFPYSQDSSATSKERKMLVRVKWLGQSSECNVEVQPSDTVGLLKKHIEESLSVPSEQQRLVFKGKSLADSQILSSYKLSHGDRIFLTVKAGVVPSSRVIPAETSVFMEALEQTLLRHFSAKDAKLVLEEFKKSYGKCMQSLNLDDIERLAAGSLQPGTS